LSKKTATQGDKVAHDAVENYTGKTIKVFGKKDATGGKQGSEVSSFVRSWPEKGTTVMIDSRKPKKDKKKPSNRG